MASHCHISAYISDDDDIPYHLDAVKGSCAVERTPIEIDNAIQIIRNNNWNPVRPLDHISEIKDDDSVKDGAPSEIEFAREILRKKIPLNPFIKADHIFEIKDDDSVKDGSAVVERTPMEVPKLRIKKEKNPLNPYIKADHIFEIKDDDGPWMKKVRTDVNKPRGRGHASSPCTIFKVQKNIRDCNPDAYTPLLVTIGPYHHQSSPSDSNYKAMENHKWLCLRRLLFRHRSSATKLLDKCLLAMKYLDAEVRSCYSESLDLLDAHSLALVMLLDGGFILHRLLQQQNLIKNHARNKDKHNDDAQAEDEEILLQPGEGDEEMEQEPMLGTLWIWQFVSYDLLKLENQIPFFVLTTLFDLLKVPCDEDVGLVKLAFKLFSDLHLSNSNSDSDSNSETFPALPEANRVRHLLHLFHSTLVPSENDHEIDVDQAVKAPKWIPNATELRQAGVKFVKKKNGRSFWDISFSTNGRMEIPEIFLYDHTDTLFRNLIAFEQCYPDTRTYITIYAAFMDCIIDSPEDVRLLHLNGILSNRLGTDEAAADLFNKLCYQIHYASDRNYLHQLFVDVNKFHKTRWNRWRAKLIRDYFSNPWAILSLIAAVLLLLLTVEQAFFSAYSYFHPS